MRVFLRVLLRTFVRKFVRTALPAAVLAWGCGACAVEPAACPPPLPAASPAGPALDRGLLWRISQGGHSSWLFGTVHVGRPDWQRFGPKLTSALNASDELALELDPNDPAVARALADAPPLPPLSPELQQRVARAFDRACIAAGSLLALHPLLQLTTLTVLDARWLGMDPAYAMEQLLLTQQPALARHVVALETAALQRASLLPDDPAEVQAAIEQTLAQLEDQSGRRVLARLTQAWERGDLAALEDYPQWCECAGSADERAWLRRLNDERNPGLADGIAARHRRGARVFAAVGALHMTGPQSLPRLLAARGFTVERVAFVGTPNRPRSGEPARRTMAAER